MVPPASVSVGSAHAEAWCVAVDQHVAGAAESGTPKVTRSLPSETATCVMSVTDDDVGVRLQAQLDVEGIAGDIRLREREFAGRLEIIVQAVVGDDMHVAPGLAVDRAGHFERVGDGQRDRRQRRRIAARVGVDGIEGDGLAVARRICPGSTVDGEGLGARSRQRSARSSSRRTLCSPSTFTSKPATVGQVNLPLSSSPRSRLRHWQSPNCSVGKRFAELHVAEIERVDSSPLCVNVPISAEIFELRRRRFPSREGAVVAALD